MILARLQLSSFGGWFSHVFPMVLGVSLRANEGRATTGMVTFRMSDGLSLFVDVTFASNTLSQRSRTCDLLSIICPVGNSYAGSNDDPACTALPQVAEGHGVTM